MTLCWLQNNMCLIVCYLYDQQMIGCNILQSCNALGSHHHGIRFVPRSSQPLPASPQHVASECINCHQRSFWFLNITLCQSLMHSHSLSDSFGFHSNVSKQLFELSDTARVHGCFWERASLYGRDLASRATQGFKQRQNSLFHKCDCRWLTSVTSEWYHNEFHSCCVPGVSMCSHSHVLYCKRKRLSH